LILETRRKKVAKAIRKKKTSQPTTKKQRRTAPSSSKKKKKKKKTSKKQSKKVSKKKVTKKKIAKKATSKKKVTRKKISKKTSNKPINKPFHRYFNRDINWLDFNYRVLHEALDSRTPLLERLRFCDIYCSNLDEFFMKRIGALHRKLESDTGWVDINGTSVEELHQNVREKILRQLELFGKNFNQQLKRKLRSEGIKLLSWRDVSDVEKRRLLTYFKRNIYPILTPLAVDSGHPFPFLSNLSKSIGIRMRRPRERTYSFARVKIPTEINQWVKLKGDKDYPFRFINIEEIIKANLYMLFSGMVIESTTLFRVTRNAAINEEEGDDTEDKMEWVESGLKERKFAPVVRLEIDQKADFWIVDFLKDELNLTDEAVYEVPCLASYTNFSMVYDIQRPDLKFEKYPPRPLPGFEAGPDNEQGPFHALRHRDFLAHFPFESFKSSVETFIQIAAEDPQVRAIKIILYRTDTSGQLVDALIKAAENKKQVACIIELKARFDEENNIQWAQKLEEAGVHVAYGLMDKKTHAKMILVVRQDADGIRTYVNLGTGNYNSQTSKVYTDLSLFTSKKVIAEEVVEVFNYLTGRSLKFDYSKLLVAPFNMFDRFFKLIKDEERFARQGIGGRIIAKMNQLEDPKTIEALYHASQQGVKITLYIRGFCNLRPGIAGMSENIEVFSIVGRLLEHSRVFYFGRGQKDPVDGEFYIGSADWMYRNLFDRVEVITPINQRDLKQRLWNYFELISKDNRHLWVLGPDGEYLQRRPKNSDDEHNAQVICLERNLQLRKI
jgi:polyphosphate kinase